MRSHETRASRRQLIIGLIVLPLSLLPFVAYGTMTPEGRLLKDKAELAVAPPELGSIGGLRAGLDGAIPMYRNAVMPLVYHGVGSTSSEEGDFAVSPDRFGEHLAALRAADVHFVTPERVAEAFDGGRPLPPRAVLLTFDDGRTDAMMWATPLLEKAHAAATMFVITGAAADPGLYYAGWDDLARYDRGPWNLQSHTDQLHIEQRVDSGEDLPALTSLAPGESLDAFRARIRADLDRADEELQARTGRRPVAFAYPFGAYGGDRTNDPAVQRIVREEIESRYRLAFHQDEQSTIPLATADSDRLGLRRLSVGNWSGTTLVSRIAAAVTRTFGSGDELEVAPPFLVDDAVAALSPPGRSNGRARAGRGATVAALGTPATARAGGPVVASGAVPRGPAAVGGAPVLSPQGDPAAEAPTGDRVPAPTTRTPTTEAPRTRTTSPPRTSPTTAPATSSPTTSPPHPSDENPGKGKGREGAPGQQGK